MGQSPAGTTCVPILVLPVHRHVGRVGTLTVQQRHTKHISLHAGLHGGR